MEYLALCCIVKDETPYLEEWIAFHTLMGVESFIIYDNESRIPVRDTLRRLLDNRYISIIHVTGKAQQIPCYDHCLSTFGKQFAWIGFIDMDEYALPLQHGDLRLMLTQYSHAAGFAAHWMQFGSNGHKTRPAGLQIESYTMTLPEAEPASLHVKLFVQPRYVRCYLNPHTVSCLPGYSVVNSAGAPVKAPISHPVVRDVCQINHYYYRSNQDFYEKQLRGRADIATGRVMTERIKNPHGDTEDMRAARFAPLVRRLLADDGACARMATRLRLPDTPDAAAALIGDTLNAGNVQDAFILLAKLARAFPEHPVTMALLAQAGPLAESLGLSLPAA